MLNPGLQLQTYMKELPKGHEAGPPNHHDEHVELSKGFPRA